MYGKFSEWQVAEEIFLKMAVKDTVSYGYDE